MQQYPVCYWELASNDAERSVQFFHDVFGWTFEYDERSTIHELPAGDAQKAFAGGGMRSFCLYVIFSLAVPLLATGQLNLVEHLVDGNIHGTASLYACDVDNDCDLDILGASMEEHTIDWWRNDGGSPIQWTRIIIGTQFIQAGSVFAADLNGDSLTDVLGAARIGDQIAWWHNNGGNPVTWTKYIIRNGYDLAHEVYACDFDFDGDADVFAAASDANEITWWRNDGGFPVQWTEQAIDTAFANAKSVHVADLDADGDLDVVGAAFDDNYLSWWRNDGGSPIQWTEYQIPGPLAGAHHVQAVDIDLDGRVDILGAAYYSETIAWWRNNGGDPISWTKQNIDVGFSGACVAQAVDLDADTDVDVVATAQTGNQVAWWRNNGGSPFQWTEFVIDSLSRAWPLFCCDLDQDGDIDIIAGSSWAGSNEVKWYENRGSAVTEAGQEFKPLTPRVSSMIIRGDIALPKDRVCRIIDASGRAVSPDRLPGGIYYLVIDGVVQIRIVKLK
jgi:hypothetical protein